MSEGFLIILFSTATLFLVLLLASMGIYWFYLIFSFRKKVKKINPSLAFKLPFFNPLMVFKLGFKMMGRYGLFDFLSDRKMKAILDEFFNIQAVRRLNNKELNRLVSKIERHYKVYSFLAVILAALIILITVIGLLLSFWIV